MKYIKKINNINTPHCESEPIILMQLSKNKLKNMINIQMITNAVFT